MKTSQLTALILLIASIACSLAASSPVMADAAADQQLVQAVTKADNQFGGTIVMDQWSSLPQPQQAQARQRVVLVAVRAALAAGASPNAKADEHSSEDSALTLATWRNYTDVVKLLLDKGAQVSAGDQYGNTPLQAISLTTPVELVEAILKHGGDVNKATGRNSAPFFWAIRLGRYDLVELMLAYHADLNKRNEQGATPLMAAAEAGQLGMIKLFLRHGADIYAHDGGGATALVHTACEQYPAHPDPTSAVTEFLIEHGLSANDQPTNGMNALQAAAFYGHRDTVALLLAHGANPRVKDSSGTTAIGYARDGAFGHKTSPDAIVALLRAAGATE